MIILLVSWRSGKAGELEGCSLDFDLRTSLDFCGKTNTFFFRLIIPDLLTVCIDSLTSEDDEGCSGNNLASLCWVFGDELLCSDRWRLSTVTPRVCFLFNPLTSSFFLKSLFEASVRSSLFFLFAALSLERWFPLGTVSLAPLFWDLLRLDDLLFNSGLSPTNVLMRCLPSLCLASVLSL